ncbi:MAG: hypothetical protein ACOH2E_03855 [Candidatus Paracaedibacter sp.]
MKVFIDESGSFIANEKRGHNFSCTGALILPSHKLGKVYERFNEITANWPRDEKKEIKGSGLGEEQITEVAKMLRRYDCLLEVVAVNMGF